MSPGQRMQDRQRFTPLHALLGAVVLLAAGILVSSYQDRLFRAQQNREIRAQGDILAASVTAALVFGDAKAVQEHVDALAINPEIEAAGVYDIQPRLVASFVRKGRPALPRSPAERTATAGPGRTLVVVPVIENGAALGTVYIRAIDEPLDRRLTRYAAIMLLAIMAAMFVAFMAATQRTLRAANAQLETRAIALAETNQLLETEMEERSKTEDALRQSQKMEVVGQLSGGLAHDFNNLLTIIQGNLHLLGQSLEREESGQSETHGYVAAAGEAVERASELVRRLLAFARRQPLSPRSVDLSQLASAMENLIVHSVGEGVRIEWLLDATWQTLCDVNQMENVILNLAINARDAMPDGGTLSIETTDLSLSDGVRARGIAPGDYVELRVCDTGTGMTDDVRKRAGDPFFTTKPYGKGTGLGLSTALAFIRQSDGDMRIETEPGKGTTIVILLPRHIVTESQETRANLVGSA